ncbi:hypothetical protein CEUSTIGMA_g5995.t1 [Chlamydomonas eustigma]|uniref:Uncharacterized protein n=1 Tax=Chlamydomonas eustigma TaxID=1157962 RepID=A0A250X662_9CHLO|nr:hypothetical protein CEUSTIGMA_g5995.t1 [Chlamydomonas eustigma]|eukprot:GAX78555.1 hypothetical protein CEUSTIGMA_g5995.t1 [Chlamydomonas eustigma]
MKKSVGQLRPNYALIEALEYFASGSTDAESVREKKMRYAMCNASRTCMTKSEEVEKPGLLEKAVSRLPVMPKRRRSRTDADLRGSATEISSLRAIAPAGTSYNLSHHAASRSLTSQHQGHSSVIDLSGDNQSPIPLIPAPRLSNSTTLDQIPTATIALSPSRAALSIKRQEQKQLRAEQNRLQSSTLPLMSISNEHYYSRGMEMITRLTPIIIAPVATNLPRPTRRLPTPRLAPSTAWPAPDLGPGTVAGQQRSLAFNAIQPFSPYSAGPSMAEAESITAVAKRRRKN